MQLEEAGFYNMTVGCVINDHFEVRPHDKSFSGERRSIFGAQGVCKPGPADLSERQAREQN